MIICKTCCKGKCITYDTCAANLKAGYPATCEVCGKEGPCLECRSEAKNFLVSKSPQAVDRFLALLRPVAETLADRERKYGGVYQELRQKRGFTDIAPLEWEVEKKLRRYKEAIKHAQYETALDCLIDIIGYCVLEMELLREREEAGGGKDKKG